MFSISGLVLSYLITILVIIWKKFSSKGALESSYALGKWPGLIMNCFAAAFLMIVFIFSCFPVHPAISVNQANWAFPILFGLMLVLTVCYFGGARKHYTAPIEHMKRDC